MHGDDAVNDTQHLARDHRTAGEEKTQVTYRIAVGAQQGRKVFALQTVPVGDPDNIFPTFRLKLPVSRSMQL